MGRSVLDPIFFMGFRPQIYRKKKDWTKNGIQNGIFHAIIMCIIVYIYSYILHTCRMYYCNDIHGKLSRFCGLWFFLWSNNGKWVTWGPFLFFNCHCFLQPILENNASGPHRNMWLLCFYWWVKNTPSNRQKHGRIPRPSENEPQLPMSQCHINASPRWFLTASSPWKNDS